MSALGQSLFLWAATAWLHGLCLFALVWIIQTLGVLKSPALAQTAWRAVIVAPIISAALQVFVLHGAPIRLTLPSPQPERSLQAATGAAALPWTAPASAAGQTPAARPPVRQATEPAPRLSELLLARAAPAVGWVWVALGVLLALRLTVQTFGLGTYRRRLKPVDDIAARSEAEALARRAGLKRLRLLEDTALSSPIAIAPDAVVLPTWTHAALTDAQRSALLAHEVWHLKRRDPQWRALFGTVAALTLAPHGVLVMRRLDDLAEEACDAWAAHQSGGGQPLAECLAACLEHASRLGLGGAIPSGVAAMARRHSPVVQRVRRLLQEPAMKPQTRPISHHALAAVLLGAAALAAPGLALSGAPAAPAVVAGPSDAAAREAAVAAADAAVAAQDAATAAQDAAVAALDSAAAERDSAIAAQDSALAARDSAAAIAGRWVERGAAEPADAYDAEDVPAPPAPPEPPEPPLPPEPPEAPMASLDALDAFPPLPPAPPLAPRAPLPPLAPLARIAPPPPPPPPPPVPPRPPSRGA
jgi:beta-lactamase regulating signal transducer with metallopeptidase domain